MLLTSPEDNHSSLSIGFVQKQTEITESQCSIAGDRVSSDHLCEPSSNSIRADGTEALTAKALTSAHGTVGAVSFLPLPLSQPSRFQKARAHETELDGLYALRQAAGLNALRTARTSLLSRGTLAKLNASSASGYAEISSFAAPLAPLRVRDIQALAELFLRDDIFAIEADVSQRLLALLPEPCWEDEVFAFLGEFL
jgi:hypothetical protein